MPVAHAPAQHLAHAHVRSARFDHAVVRGINRARSRYGLPRLRFSRPLMRCATRHSRDLTAHGTLSHYSSSGAPFEQRIHRATRARSVGETIALFRGHLTAPAVVRAWLASPSHRVELLSPAYGRVGVGLSRGGRSSVITADFAGGR